MATKDAFLNFLILLCLYKSIIHDCTYLLSWNLLLFLRICCGLFKRNQNDYEKKTCQWQNKELVSYYETNETRQNQSIRKRIEIFASDGLHCLQLVYIHQIKQFHYRTNLHFIKCDLSKSDEVFSATANIQSASDHIDLLILNAAMFLSPRIGWFPYRFNSNICLLLSTLGQAVCCDIQQINVMNNIKN
ncbi:hypothetical protein Mgra_00007778 [Meloidogyne graminicola]|uniref:Uncharacterized protein n=1 Tax=Meloidogyne graminicola TaxID=189291 RepID=A0A8S9ZHQ1_9BILA|nr:hypothetical protein Mgra_00007778 [Meloidogyne graminicola]